MSVLKLFTGMISAYRVRCIFRHGAKTHSHALRVLEAKGIHMVEYLRFRRCVAETSSYILVDVYLKNKRWHRKEHLRRVERIRYAKPFRTAPA